MGKYLSTANPSVSSDVASAGATEDVESQPMDAFIESILCKPLSFAETLAQKRGYKIRCVRVDGVDAAETNNYRPNRCNVVIHDGIVTDVQGFY